MNNLIKILYQFLIQLNIALNSSNQLFSMISQVSWKKENDQLEEDAGNISRLKKEISKEAQVDISIQASITDKIEILKQNATILAKRLQNQKHKNLQLDTIIKHIKSQIEDDKLLEATHRNDINFDSMTSLDNKMKKLEYDLSQISSRSNKIFEKVADKRMKVNQTRTQRVIDSGIFRNIEKELKESELNFKKLLIQKTKHQKQYEKLLKQYNSIKQKAQSYIGGNIKSDRNNKSGKTSVQSPFPPVQEGQNIDKKFIEIERSTGKAASFHRNGANDQEIEESQQKEYTLKKIMLQTGIDKIQDLLYFFHNIDQINQEYFIKMNKYADQTTEIEKEIIQIESAKKNNKIQFYQTKRQLSKGQKKALKCNDLNNKMIEVEAEINKELNAFSQFFKCETVIKFFQEFKIKADDLAKQTKADNFDFIKEVLQKIEDQISNLLKTPIHQKDPVNLTSRSSKEEKLNQMISRIKKYDECDKVMKREDFRDEYRKMLKSNTQKIISNRQTLAKRKSLGKKDKLINN